MTSVAETTLTYSTQCLISFTISFIGLLKWLFHTRIRDVGIKMHFLFLAHGKRSGLHLTDPEKIGEPSWFLSKLINNPSDMRYSFERNNELNDKTELLRGSDADKTR